MPKFPRTVVALAFAASALTGCGTHEEGDVTTPAETPEFQQLIEDARYEMREDRLAEAGRLFDEVLARQPDSPAIWTDIARLRFRGGEHAEALEAAEHAVSLDSGFAPALLFRAQLVRDAFGLAPAIVWFEAGLERNPDDPDMLAEYAATLGDFGRHRDMLVAIRRLAEIAPDDPRVHFLQAVLAARASDLVLARNLLDRSGLIESGVPAAVLLGALVELEQGNSDSAASKLERLHSDQPANRRVLKLFARALWESGRDRELVDRFGELATARDSTPYLTMLVGRSLERLGDRRKAATLIQAARADYEREIKLLPASVIERSNLTGPTRQMRMLIATGQRAQARKTGTAALARAPGSSDLMALAGDGALADGDIPAALTLYGRAASIRRSWPLTRKIFYSYRALGDEDAAQALLVRHLAAEPRNPEALLVLAQMSAAEEDWLRVALLLDRVIQLGAGNDPVVLALRVRAGSVSGDAKATDRFSAWLADLSPPPFVGR